MSGVKRSFAILVFGCLVVGALFSAHAAETPPAGKTVVKLGIVGRPDMAAYGYFEKEGLAVDLIPAATAADFLAGLGMNQIQATTGSLNAALFNALNRNIDIRIVADYAHVGTENDQTAAIVARADLIDGGSLKNPADEGPFARRGACPRAAA